MCEISYQLLYLTINKLFQFSSEFNLGSYVDSGFTTAVDSSNMVTIGEPVYNKLEVSGSLPSNVDFFITECTAYVDNTYDASGTKYTIINVSQKYFKLLFMINLDRIKT